MAQKFSIERDPKVVIRYLPQIQAAADEDRKALGFLPKKAYEEQILAAKVLLLRAPDVNGQSYAGHLMFGGLFPSLRIYQIAVAAPFRRRGGGTRLIRALLSHAEREGYLSISARVATDLSSANQFYERHGFVALRTQPGGVARDRRITVRVCEVNSPSLLDLMKPSAPELSFRLGLGQRAGKLPLYAIDLNVLFDLIRNRSRTRKADALFQAALGHEIRLVVTSEFSNELERTSRGRNSDPVLAFARNLPKLPLIAPERLAPYQVRLEESLFSNRDRNKPLSPQNRSDIAQLAEAAASGAAGYITSDQKILTSRSAIQSLTQLDVISVTECVQLLRPFERGRSFVSVESGVQVEATSDVSTVLGRLRSQGVDASPIAQEAAFRGPNVRCWRIEDHQHCIGASVAGVPTIDSPFRLYVWVDEYHPLASTVADYLIGEACRTVSSNRIAGLVMTEDPAQPITRHIALGHGFRPQHREPTILQKIAVGRAITASSWGSVVTSLKSLCGVRLSKTPPALDSDEGRFSIRDENGRDLNLALSDLETLLSPVMFALPRRRAVMVPITKVYSEELIGAGSQLTLLVGQEACLLGNRTYFNSPRTSGVMIPGAAVVFYESLRGGGAGAAVAVARITDVIQVPKDRIPEPLKRAGVVRDLGALLRGEEVLATSFDNLIHFARPVPLSSLRKFGCVDAANLPTARRLDGEQLASIVSAGCDLG